MSGASTKKKARLTTISGFDETLVFKLQRAALEALVLTSLQDEIPITRDHLEAALLQQVRRASIFLVVVILSRAAPRLGNSVRHQPAMHLTLFTGCCCYQFGRRPCCSCSERGAAAAASVCPNHSMR